LTTGLPKAKIPVNILIQQQQGSTKQHNTKIIINNNLESIIYYNTRNKIIIIIIPKIVTKTLSYINIYNLYKINSIIEISISKNVKIFDVYKLN
jgi:hypothetical protein